MTALKPFQLEGVKQIYQFRGKALLADEQGLGKTISALYWVTKIPKHRPVIIITPASVKYTWQSEASLHFGLRTEVLEGNCNKQTKRLPGNIIILNYDILKSWLPVLQLAKPRCVILDEIQYIKNVTAKRTKAVFELVKDVPSVLGLSGTPLTNRPIELWPVLQAIRPDIFPNREKYAWKFCHPVYLPMRGWVFNGASKLPLLNKILRREVMIRRLKKDVLPELPAVTHKIVSFRLKSYIEYNKVQEDFIGWLKKISPSKANRAKKSQALTKVGYLLRLVAELKLEWTAKWIEEFFISHPGEKLVGLTMHTFVIDYLQERFRGRSLVIDGSVTGRKREETVRKFQSNRHFDLMLGNWKAAGVGITLTAASNIAALDFPWTPGDLAQGRDRVHRIGQRKNVFFHYLTLLETIEEKQIKGLRKKSKVLDAILNGEDAEDFDMFEEILREMKQARR